MPLITVRNLDVAYAVSGPEDGPVVLLLHGWPDDASTWDRVAERLAESGYRTIVPSLRGFGDTRFRTARASRAGDIGILATDAIGLMDELQVERFAVFGHDWGSSIAEALAVGWPERISCITLLSTTPRLGGMQTPTLQHAKRCWYHWYMATSLGEQSLRDDRRGFAYLQWVDWGPSGWFDRPTFDRVARAWDNPDWVEVTLHSYRSRWGFETPDQHSAWLVQKVKATKTLSLPVLVVTGAEDGVSPPEVLAQMNSRFTGEFKIVILPGVGHFPQREAPDLLTPHLIKFLARAGR